jgi:hypothetical protein
LKLSLSNLPNPLDDPTGFETAYNDNCTAIETAVENAAFRTGDTFPQAEEPFEVSIGRVMNGALVEGEPYEGGGGGGNPALVPDIGPFEVLCGPGFLGEIGYQDPVINPPGYGTLNSDGGDAPPNFIIEEESLGIFEMTVICGDVDIVVADVLAKYNYIGIGGIGGFNLSAPNIEVFQIDVNTWVRFTVNPTPGGLSHWSNGQLNQVQLLLV